MDNQILYSSFYSADDGADEASTVFFNDGFGRLTAFEKEYKDGRMTIIIRQNMSIVWKNTYTVSSNHFSVERIDTDGHILFRIHVGERILLLQQELQSSRNIPAQVTYVFYRKFRSCTLLFPL